MYVSCRHAARALSLRAPPPPGRFKPSPQVAVAVAVAVEVVHAQVGLLQPESSLHTSPSLIPLGLSAVRAVCARGSSPPPQLCVRRTAGP